MRVFMSLVSSLLVTLGVLCCAPAGAQILQGDLPETFGLVDTRPVPNAKPPRQSPGVEYRVPIVDDFTAFLGPVDVAALIAEDAQQQATLDVKPLRIGVGRDVGLILEDGKWYTIAGGAKVWSADVFAQGALSIRLHFAEVDLPKGAELFVYSPSGVGEVRHYGKEGLAAGGDFWAGSVFDERVRVEYFLPAGTAYDAGHVPFVIDRLQHVYHDPIAGLIGAGPSGAGPCHNDVTCFPALAGLAKAVARITFVDGGSFLCSGQLLTTTAADLTPYFLTANHCVSTQSVAQTIEVYWCYQTASCNAAPPSLASVPQSSVCSLLATASPTDFSLLMIDGVVPTGILTWAGWSPNPVANGTACTAIHHPSGDYKRVSFGTKVSGGSSGHIRIDWTDGPTEGGSSGSAVFLSSTEQVVGQLCCGPSSCGNESHDDYGNFSMLYPTIASLLAEGEDDGFEQNDSCAGAAIVGDGSYPGLVVKSGDEDWYRITIAGGGTLDLDLVFSDAFGDIDIALFSSCGGASVASSATGSDNESISFTNTGGTAEFFLRVFLFDDTRGEYSMSVSTSGGLLPNDSCVTPLAVSEGVTAFDNTGADTDGPDEPSACDFFGQTQINQDVWFCYTASTTGYVTVSLCGSGYDTKMAVYDGCGCPSADSAIACNDDACGTGGLRSEVTFVAQGGQSYMIRVGAFGMNFGSGTMDISVLPPDDCADAIAIGDGTTEFSNVGATTDGPDEPGMCDFFSQTQVNQDVWFLYTATCQGTVTASLCGSAYDTKFAVYSGASCPTTASAIACNDDACGTGGLRSEVSFPALPGEQFLLRVGAFGGNSGAGTLVVECRPDNDDCSDAITIGNGSTSGSLLGATNDGTGSCGTSDASPDVWYAYTASCTGELLVNTCGTNDLGGPNAGMDTVLTLFPTGCPVNGAAEIECNDDWPNGSDAMACTATNAGLTRDSAVALSVTAGESLLIRVSTFGSTAAAAFTLNVDCAVQGPSNDDCANAVAVSDGTTLGSLVGATSDGPGSCGNSAASPDVWYSYTATCSGMVFVSTCGTHDTGGVDGGIDTVVAAFLPNCPADLADEVDCNDDWPSGSDPTACAGVDAGASRDSAIVFPMSVGETRLIRVANFDSSATGPFQLNVACVPDVCDPVLGLACQSVGADVILNWSNGDLYTNVQVFRGGALVASLGGGATSFVDTGLPGGNYSYEVVGDCGTGLALAVSCAVSHTPPCAAVSNVQCAAVGADATVSWVNGDTYSSVRVLRDGALVATLGGGATSYLDSSLPNGTYTYSVEGDCSGTLAPGVTCSVSVSVAMGVQYRRGDCNNDGAINIADAVYLLGSLFPPPGGTPNVLVCLDACDGNLDLGVNIADAVAFLAALFGTPPTPLPAPYPNCGAGPPGGLGCAMTACP